MKSLPQNTPESQGISSLALLQWLDQLEEKGCNLHSFVLLRRGTVIGEGWWNPYRPDRRHALLSSSKSFTAVAVGFALQDRLLRLEDPVISFFPEKFSGSLPGAHIQAMTLEHLLTMTTGFTEDPHAFFFDRDTDWVWNFLRLHVPDQPGSRFVYSTHASYMLSAIVQKATGRTTFGYLEEKLFRPLGFQAPWWETCPHGISTGGWGLSLRTEDFAKFGLFLLQKGAWEGKQLLSADWVERAVSPLVDTSRSDHRYAPEEHRAGYGYQFWQGTRHSFRTSGGFGQNCLVYPDQDLVLAMTAGDNIRQGEIFGAIHRHLLPACRDAPLPENPPALAQLQGRLQRLQMAFAQGIPSCQSPEARRQSGRQYRLSPSHLDYSSISFDFSGETDRITLAYQGRAISLLAGFGTWVENDTGIADEDTDTDVSILYRRVACCGGWEGNQYELRLCFCETPYTDTIRIYFEGPALIFDFHRDVWFTGQSLDVTLYGMEKELADRNVPAPNYHIHYGFGRSHFGKPLPFPG